MNTTKFRNIVGSFDPEVIDEILDLFDEEQVSDIAPSKYLTFIKALAHAGIRSEQPQKAVPKSAASKAAGKTAYNNSVSMETPVRLLEQRAQEQTNRLNGLKSEAEDHLRNLLDNAREQTAVREELSITERQIEKLYGDNPEVERCDDNAHAPYSNTGHFH